MDLKQFAALDELADRHRLDAERLRLASAAGLVPVQLQFDKLRKVGEQLGSATEPACVMGIPDCHSNAMANHSS
jgi:hypothetical protein